MYSFPESNLIQFNKSLYQKQVLNAVTYEGTAELHI